MTRKSIHRQLLSIKRAPKWDTVGICANMDFGSTRTALKFCDAMEVWPLAKGFIKYATPVEGSMQLYLKSVADKTIWQNPRRHALLDYLISYYTPKKCTP